MVEQSVVIQSNYNSAIYYNNNDNATVHYNILKYVVQLLQYTTVLP